MDLEGIFSYRLRSREYFMIRLIGPKGRKKESPFSSVLRGIPEAGVLPVARTSKSVCPLEMQKSGPRSLGQGDLSGHEPPFPALLQRPPPQLQLLNLKSEKSRESKSLGLGSPYLSHPTLTSRRGLAGFMFPALGWAICPQTFLEFGIR